MIVSSEDPDWLPVMRRESIVRLSRPRAWTEGNLRVAESRRFFADEGVEASGAVPGCRVSRRGNVSQLAVHNVGGRGHTATDNVAPWRSPENLLFPREVHCVHVWPSAVCPCLIPRECHSLMFPAQSLFSGGMPYLYLVDPSSKKAIACWRADD
jgi:hypothetical protein